MWKFQIFLHYFPLWNHCLYEVKTYKFTGNPFSFSLCRSFHCFHWRFFFASTFFFLRWKASFFSLTLLLFTSFAWFLEFSIEFSKYKGESKVQISNSWYQTINVDAESWKEVSRSASHITYHDLRKGRWSSWKCLKWDPCFPFFLIPSLGSSWPSWGGHFSLRMFKSDPRTLLWLS